MKNKQWYHQTSIDQYEPCEVDNCDCPYHYELRETPGGCKVWWTVEEIKPAKAAPNLYAENLSAKLNRVQGDIANVQTQIQESEWYIKKAKNKIQEMQQMLEEIKGSIRG